MNENNSTKKREWVKNAIIIFLVIMLILTFFSNTIMNYSLPEVSAQYIGSGTLSEQIRGSGIVEANQSYEMKLDETRIINSVMVKVGDVVEKDQVILTLEDAESAELETARKTLDSFKLEYEKALLATGEDYTLDNLAIKNKEEDLALLKADYEKLDDYRKEYEQVEDKVKEYEKIIETYTEQLTGLSAENYSMLSGDLYNKVKKAKSAFDNAESAKAKTEEKISEYESEISSGGNEESIKSAKQAVEQKKLEITEAENDITAEYLKSDFSQEKIDELNKKLSQLELDLKHLQEDYSNALSKSTSYSRNKQRLDAEKKTLEANEKSCTTAKNNLDKVLKEVKDELKVKQSEIQDKLDDLVADSEELKGKAEKTDSEAEAEVRAMERELEQMKASLAQKQQSDAASAGATALDMQAKQQEITEQEELVKKLEGKAIGAEIKAQVAGRITAIPYAAGEEAAQGSSVATIEMTDKGYTLEMTITAEQARKVKVGDEAEIQYFWYGDAKAVLSAIKPDTTNPAKNKILKFEVTGDVTPGQNLQLSMGAKGQQYETIVPNSAIREDNNGKFVLAVKAKSSPLGNRYTAERVDIEVLASDDTSSAISGGLFGGEFIITTATKPIESGMQVRLVES
ncbi:MAG: HlyD family efflux transporter periplasmic adaptor subunit [Oscillospiraceae bacterium]|nr:HlyD family efflux transporter periplasmic adaptor subunit [Oscillospiraceae bacterium]